MTASAESPHSGKAASGNRSTGKSKSGPFKLVFDTFYPVGILAIVTIAILSYSSSNDTSLNNSPPQLGAAVGPTAGKPAIRQQMQDKLRASILRQAYDGLEASGANQQCSSIENILLKNEQFGNIGRIDKNYQRQSQAQHLPALISEVHYTCVREGKASRKLFVRHAITALDEDDIERCNASRSDAVDLQFYIEFCQFSVHSS